MEFKTVAEAMKAIVAGEVKLPEKISFIMEIRDDGAIVVKGGEGFMDIIITEGGNDEG